MIRKVLLAIIIINLLGCKSIDKAQIVQEKIIDRCSLIEERFEDSSMKIFLESTKNSRQTIDMFLADNSKISFLSLTGKESVFAKNNNKNEWEIFNNNNSYIIENSEISAKINEYVDLDLVYKLNCPKDFGVFDGNNGFQAIWIKEKGIIKFLYYSTSYDINNLNEIDKNKISSLIEIDYLFKK